MAAPVTERPIPPAILARYEAGEIVGAWWDGSSVVIELEDVVMVHRPGRAAWSAWIDALLDEMERAAATAGPVADETTTKIPA